MGVQVRHARSHRGLRRAHSGCTFQHTTKRHRTARTTRQVMMPSWPYLHTLINHFPIILTVVGTLALLLALVYPRRGLWLYALGTLTLAGITIYPAWLSGDQAAETVHKAWYIQPGSIHQHAQAADITMYLLLALGLASLVAWASIVRAREAFAPAPWLRTVVAVLGVIGLIAVSYTGYRGGQIVVDSPILASPTPPVLSPPATTPALAPITTQPSPQAVPQPGTAAPLGQPMQAPLAPIPQQTAPVTVQPPTPHVSPPATH